MGDMSREDRIHQGRVVHGVGTSTHLPGNVCHLVSPIVGMLRLDQRDGRNPSAEDVDWMIQRLSLVLDLANEEAERQLKEQDDG